jgi:malonyl CoA-acyl carrier protein transacylase
MYPPAAATPEDEAAQKAALTDTRVAQPAWAWRGWRWPKLLHAAWVDAEHARGHSYGELVALLRCRRAAEASLLELSELRGRRILESTAHAQDPGTMAAVAADPATARRISPDSQAW